MACPTPEESSSSGTGGTMAVTPAALAKRRPGFGSTAGNSSPADLASLFECPVCFDYVLPPIFQCQAGHLGKERINLEVNLTNHK